MRARAQLQENNIDPRMIDNMIANSPAVRQAKAATAELNSYRASRMMEEDFKKVLSIDPTKTSEEDILNDPAYMDVVNYIEMHPGTRFDEAYKIVNFERLTDSRGAAAKQAVVNQVKSKNHLSTGTSIDVKDSDEDIPPTMVEQYKELFPEKFFEGVEGELSSKKGPLARPPRPPHPDKSIFKIQKSLTHVKLFFCF